MSAHPCNDGDSSKTLTFPPSPLHRVISFLFHSQMSFFYEQAVTTTTTTTWNYGTTTASLVFSQTIATTTTTRWRNCWSQMSRRIDTTTTIRSRQQPCREETPTPLLLSHSKWCLVFDTTQDDDSSIKPTTTTTATTMPQPSSDLIRLGPMGRKEDNYTTS